MLVCSSTRTRPSETPPPLKAKLLYPICPTASMQFLGAAFYLSASLCLQLHPGWPWAGCRGLWSWFSAGRRPQTQKAPQRSQVWRRSDAAPGTGNCKKQKRLTPCHDLDGSLMQGHVHDSEGITHSNAKKRPQVTTIRPSVRGKTPLCLARMIRPSQ